MPVPELAFMGVQAFVTQKTSASECSFIHDETDFDPKHLVPIDLGKNTNQPQWTNVQVDAHRSMIPAGLTSIGPEFHIAKHVGVVYLELNLFKKLQDKGFLPNWPRTPDHDYQYMNVVRWGTPKHSRFHGFHVDVQEVSGTVAHLAIYVANTKNQTKKTLWLDLMDARSCDPASYGYTTVQPVANTSGALFLSWDVIRANDIKIPKLPIGDGDDGLPT